MFFRILKKDLKKKRTMNVILFLFLVVTSMLVASGVNLLLTVSGAMDHFFEVSGVPDHIAILSYHDTAGNGVGTWMKGSGSVEEGMVDTGISLAAENVMLPGQDGKVKLNNLVAAVKQSNTYGIIFDDKDEPYRLEKGQLAAPEYMLQNMKLKPGDQINLVLPEITKEFTIAGYTKDAVFGSSMMGLTRVLINDEDYDSMYQAVKKESRLEFWSFISKEGVETKEMVKDFSRQSFPVVFDAEISTIRTSYTMDMMLAGIILVVSVLLMLIALFILRFTILFTLQEEYREIGIMKAIGIKKKAVRRIYLVKYTFLALSGGAVGFLCSIWFSKVMLAGLQKRMIVEPVLSYYICSACAAVGMVLLTILFCQACTSRINRFSVVDAIRGGNTGESFSVRRKIKLYKSGRTKVAVLLAISDIWSGMRRFLLLIFTFFIGTILILIPVNIINTLKSDDIIELLNLGEMDLTVSDNDWAEFLNGREKKELVQRLDEIKADYRKEGIDISFYPEISYMASTYADDRNETRTIYINYAIGRGADEYGYLEGTAPVLADEVAITEIVADYFGIGIGDMIHCTMGGKTYDYYVTALFQSISNLGYGIRLSEQNEVGLSGCARIMVPGQLSPGQDTAAVIQKMKQLSPEYTIRDTSEVIRSMLGSVMDQIDIIRNIILVTILGMNVLITILLVKMLLSKEIPEVAVLKSLGFRNKDLRRWQMLRLFLILLTAVGAGALLSSPASKIATVGIFRMVGITRLVLTIVPLQVYVFYPLLILGTAMAASRLSIGDIKRVKVWEINNQE